MQHYSRIFILCLNLKVIYCCRGKPGARKPWTAENMKQCLADIESGKRGVNAASKYYNIPKPSIRRYRLGLNKISNTEKIHRGAPLILPKHVEEELVQHMKDLDGMFFGMTKKELMRLGYQIALSYGVTGLNHEKKMLGKGWYYGFMGRHPELCLRSPEATSLGRMKGFNRQAVQAFFDLYSRIIQDNSITADRIFNMDETSHSTVQKCSKVVSLKGKKQVGAVTSTERGTNTTGVYCVSATGRYIPPMLIFKRLRMADSLKEGAPAGTAFACTKSGWIDSDVFVEWLKHFIEDVKPTQENKILLLLDGHSSHSKNIEAINLAREKGVIMMSFPSHCTHRLQPLDVAFFKSLKTVYNSVIEQYLRTSMGKGVGMHQIAGFVGKAFLKTANMETALNGFRKTGLWPLDAHVFDEEFSLQERCRSVEEEPSSQADQQPSAPPATGTRDQTPPQTDQQPNAPPATGSKDQTPFQTEQQPNAPPAHSSRDQFPSQTEPLHTTAQRDPSPFHAFHSIPTRGDGKCFFRAVAIALKADLQNVERDAVTGKCLNPIKALMENAEADNIRTKMISHMCSHPPFDLQDNPNVDMPNHVHFADIGERILHMSDPKSMVGEAEVRSTSQALGISIHVKMEGSGFTSSYDVENSKNDVFVKYIPNADAGHYEALVRRPSLQTISPFPKHFASKSSTASASQVFTASPYKKGLEAKKKTVSKNKAAKKRAPLARGHRETKKKPKVQETDSSSSDEEQTNPSCLVCCERFKDSRSGETWTQCVQCKRWSHLECTPNDGHAYLCHNCDSEDDEL